MAALEGISAVTIRFCEHFKFREPMFFPQALHKRFLFLKKEKDARALSDPRQMKTLINHGTHLPLEILKLKKNDLGEKDKRVVLKPIRKPYTHEEVYWAAFAPHNLNRRGNPANPLPVFPFQVLFHTLNIQLPHKAIEQIIGTSVRDACASCDVWLFPPGIASAHFSLYIEVPVDTLDPQKILEIKHVLSTNRNAEVMNIKVTDANRTSPKTYSKVPDFLQDLMDRLFHTIIVGDPPHSHIIGTNYTFYNFRALKPGANIQWEDYKEGFTKLLMNKNQIKDKDVKNAIQLVKAGRHDGDWSAIGDEASISYVDKSLWDQDYVKDIVKARRCFRHHFESTVEMAYITKKLIKEYASVIKTIKTDIEVRKATHKPFEDFAGFLFQQLPLSDIELLTMRNVINNVENFQYQQGVYDGETRDLETQSYAHDWYDVFLMAAKQFDIPQQLRGINILATELSKQLNEDIHERFADLVTTFGLITNATDTALKVFK